MDQQRYLRTTAHTLLNLEKSAHIHQTSLALPTNYPQNRPRRHPQVHCQSYGI